MKDLKQIEKEVIDEEANIEAKAFEMFIKDDIKQDLDSIKNAEERLERVKKRKGEKTVDIYKELFNTFNSMSGCSNKEHYISKIKE